MEIIFHLKPIEPRQSRANSPNYFLLLCCVISPSLRSLRGPMWRGATTRREGAIHSVSAPHSSLHSARSFALSDRRESVRNGEINGIHEDAKSGLADAIIFFARNEYTRLSSRLA